MSGEELDEPGSKPAAAVGPGTILGRKRESAGISQREVADALNLPMHTVEAIESDDRTRLPPHVFTRGYIRAYAKLLELDAEPLVAALEVDRETGSEIVEADPPQLGAVGRGDRPRNFVLPTRISTKNVAITGGVILGIGILLVLLWTVFGDHAQEGAGRLDAPIAADPVAVVAPVEAERTRATSPREPTRSDVDRREEPPPVPQTAAPQQQTRPAQQQSETVQQPSRTARQTVQAAQARPDVAAPVPTTKATDTTASSPVRETGQGDGVPKTDEASLVRRLTAEGTDELTLEFSDECWVEVGEPGGTNLFVTMGRPGEKLSFVGQGPFRVKLGYAPGVLMVYNSETIALSTRGGDNVANVVVGGPGR